MIVGSADFAIYMDSPIWWTHILIRLNRSLCVKPTHILCASQIVVHAVSLTFFCVEKYYTLFFIRIFMFFFFRTRLDILIFLPILGWKYSCHILRLRIYHDTFYSLVNVFCAVYFTVYYMYHSSNCISIEHWKVSVFIALLGISAI